MWVFKRVGGGWGWDWVEAGGWMPLPTRPQRYCDPASLVLFLRFKSVGPRLSALRTTSFRFSPLKHSIIYLFFTFCCRFCHVIFCHFFAIHLLSATKETNLIVRRSSEMYTLALTSGDMYSQKANCYNCCDSSESGWIKSGRNVRKNDAHDATPFSSATYSSTPVKQNLSILLRCKCIVWKHRITYTYEETLVLISECYCRCEIRSLISVTCGAAKAKKISDLLSMSCLSITFAFWVSENDVFLLSWIWTGFFLGSFSF